MVYAREDDTHRGTLAKHLSALEDGGGERGGTSHQPSGAPSVGSAHPQLTTRLCPGMVLHGLTLRTNAHIDWVRCASRRRRLGEISKQHLGAAMVDSARDSRLTRRLLLCAAGLAFIARAGLRPAKRRA